MVRKLKELKELKDKSQGFTIIEVLIVLAIAGLIILIVFLAVPALQRNSRNNSRRQDVAHIAGLVNEFAANHGGKLPTGVLAPATPCPTATNVQLDLCAEKFAIIDPAQVRIFNSNAMPAVANDTYANINTNYKCDASAATLLTGSASTNPRLFSMSFVVETGGNNSNTCING